MNPMMTEFLAESRDLLKDAGEVYLALETAPADADLLAKLFRAVHTIKGASGLFAIAPFTEAMHAVEDVLDALRSGRMALTADMGDAFLALLDQAGAWLEELEKDERLGDGAGDTAEALGERLRGYLSVSTEVVAPSASEVASSVPWLAIIPAEVRARGALVAVTYVPDERCFFSGDDPLFNALSTPSQVFLQVEPKVSWPSPAEVDPFASNLRYLIVSSAPIDEVRHHFRYVTDAVELAHVPAPERDPQLVSAAVQLLEAQVEALGHEAGRASARVVLARVLEALGMGALDDRDPLASAKAALASLGRGAVVEAKAAARAVAPRAAAETSFTKARSFKVDVTRVDELVDLAGELIVAKNALPFLARQADEIDGAGDLAKAIRQQHAALSRAVDDLQHAVMQVRMMAVEHVFSRFPRLVRDLAKKQDKRVRVVMEGGETEADKNMIEDLAEPLLHCVRNAIDHGIELPEERLAAGKPEEAELRLSARREGERVVIEIGDDGRGIDVERVKAKALERGLIERAAAEVMSDEELVQLIFVAGFSTAERVSDVSGRGVGMDIVRSAVRANGGDVSVHTDRGKGTCIRLSVPLSMAVTRVMIVEVAKERYGVPLGNVVEVMRRPSSDLRKVKQREALSYRDRLLPVYRLARAFDCAAPADGDEVSLLVISTEHGEAALLVDRFHEGVDVILKPREGVLAPYRTYAGTAMLGDGSVLLVLDPKELLTWL